MTVLADELLQVRQNGENDLTKPTKQSMIGKTEQVIESILLRRGSTGTVMFRCFLFAIMGNRVRQG